MQTLDVGSTFPSIRARTIDDEPFDIPGEASMPMVVLFYRGHW